VKIFSICHLRVAKWGEFYTSKAGVWHLSACADLKAGNPIKVPLAFVRFSSPKALVCRDLQTPYAEKKYFLLVFLRFFLHIS
jgi:hypothetical protein